MSKIVGFNKEVATKAEETKKSQQRAESLKDAGKSVHFQRRPTNIPNPVLNPVLKG